MKHKSHSKLYYGLVDKRGRVYGGMTNPHLFSLTSARKMKKQGHCKTIVGIRVTYEVVSEVID